MYQMLANYQRGVEGSRLGGEGYLRIVTFNRKTREIDVKTYSTWNKAYHPSEHHNFKFREVDFDDAGEDYGILVDKRDTAKV